MQTLLGEIWIAQAAKHHAEDNQVVVSIMKQLYNRKDKDPMIFTVDDSHSLKDKKFGLQRIYQEINGLMTLYSLHPGDTAYKCSVLKWDFFSDVISEKFNTDTFALTFKVDIIETMRYEPFYRSNDESMDGCKNMQTLLGHILINQMNYILPVSHKTTFPSDASNSDKDLANLIMQQLRKNKDNDPNVFSVDKRLPREKTAALQWVHDTFYGLMTLYGLHKDEDDDYSCYRITDFEDFGTNLFALLSTRHGGPHLVGLRRETVDKQLS